MPISMHTGVPHLTHCRPLSLSLLSNQESCLHSGRDGISGCEALLSLAPEIQDPLTWTLRARFVARLIRSEICDARGPLDHEPWAIGRTGQASSSHRLGEPARPLSFGAQRHGRTSSWIR